MAIAPLGVEWYDIEKVRRRLFPAPFRTLLNFELSSNSYRWLDLQYTHDRPFRLEDFNLKSLSRPLDVMGAEVTPYTGSTRKGWSFSCPKAIFNECAKVDLRHAAQDLRAAPGLALDIEVKVSAGAVGVGLVEASGAYLPGAETVIASGPDMAAVTLRAVGIGMPAALAFRNMQDDIPCVFTVHSAVLRVAN